MSFTVRIAPRAWSDADGIFDWLAARSPAGASRWYGAFLSAARQLTDDADRHGIAPESEVLGRTIRQRFFKTRRGRVYRLLFIEQGDELTILRIRGPGQAPVSADEMDSG
jgi:plasmid stabilization system protein ParE